MKTCYKCKLEKPVDEFYNNRKTKDGKDHRCKQCARDYKAANRDKFTRYETDRYNRKRKEIREKVNAKYVHRYTRIPSTPESIKASKNKWKKKNPHKLTEYASRRRAAQYNQVPPDVDLKAIQEIYKEARQRRLNGEDVHVDHIIPLLGKEMRGMHSADNLRIIPAKENLSKGNRIIPELVVL